MCDKLASRSISSDMLLQFFCQYILIGIGCIYAWTLGNLWLLIKCAQVRKVILKNSHAYLWPSLLVTVLAELHP